MAPLRLNVLGGFRLFDATGAEVPVSGRKVKALLAYLCLHPDQPSTRETLSTLLWGDRPDAQARQSLRHALSALRKVLGASQARLIVTDGEAVSVAADGIDVDALAFARMADHSRPEALRAATDRYGGALLDGLQANSEDFDAWAARERERLKEKACDLLDRLAEQESGQGNTDAAGRALQRLLSLDPTREEAHCALMRVYERAGRRSAALKQYRLCTEALRQELDVEPAPETRRLYEQIREAGLRDAAPLPPKAETVEEFEQGAAYPLPARPSVAILAFDDLGAEGAPPQLGDGFSDNLITQLSSLPRLFVIARNSSFLYKGRAVDIRQVGRELGVRYVLEGSIQVDRTRIRVAAQLIDAATGHHVWAERYDRRREQLFDVQDEIAERIALSLQIELTEDEAGARMMRETTRSLEAWGIHLQALEHFRRMNPEDNRRARELDRRALRIDPDYGAALTLLGWTHHWDARYGFTQDREADFDRAINVAQQVLRLYPDFGPAYALSGCTLGVRGHYDQGMADMERAVALFPNNADTVALLAMALHHTGRHESALTQIELAMRLSPLHADWYLSIKGHILFQLRCYEAVLPVLAEARRRLPRFPNNFLTLMATYAALGSTMEAEEVRREFLQFYPDYEALVRVPQAYPYQHAEDLEHLLRNLEKAGLR